MKTMNNDVPPEAIIKQLLIENGKLKSEIAHLESEIESKDKAIAAFKEWQIKVVDFKYRYWLNEGIWILKERPSEKVLHHLRSIIQDNYVCKKIAAKLEAISKRMENEEKINILEKEWERLTED